MKRFLALFLALVLLLTGLAAVASAKESEGFHWKDGKPYYINSDGSVLKGWKEIIETEEYEGETYSWSYWIYGKADGYLVYNDWLQSGSQWRYFDGYTMVAGYTLEIKGEYHLFDEDGIWRVSTKEPGWVKRGNNWYYAEKRSYEWAGETVTEILFCTDGAFQIDNVYYYFDKTGKCQTKAGWVRYDWKDYYGITHSDWYYVTNGGVLAKGWKRIEGHWFFFTDWGYMVNDTFRWIGEEGKEKLYAFAKTGIMYTNKWYHYEWYDDEDELHTVWTYLGEDGAAKTGWFKVGKKWYYSGETGWIWMDCSVTDSQGNIYWLGKDGDMLLGWQQIYSVEWSYFKSSGAMARSEWLQYGGKWYYFDENGLMVHGCTITINGTEYTFDANGAWVG